MSILKFANDVVKSAKCGYICVHLMMVVTLFYFLCSVISVCQIEAAVVEK